MAFIEVAFRGVVVSRVGARIAYAQLLERRKHPSIAAILRVSTQSARLRVFVLPWPMHDLLAPILALIPEAYRPTVIALVSLVCASQIVASQIVAQLPKSALEHPRYGRIVRALHWYGHARLRDENGTTKLPGGTVLDDPRDAEIDRLRALVASSVPVEVAPAAERESIVAPAPSEAKADATAV